MSVLQLCCHNEDSCPDIIDYYKGLGIEIKVIPIKELDGIDLKTETMLVANNSQIKEYSAKLHDAGINELKVFITDLMDIHNEQPLEINNDLPRLDRLEIEIYRRCNLNCRGCSHFSNIVTESGVVDIENFEKDLRQMSRFYWGIETLRLMGGEPLLANNFTDFVSIARSIFPDADISLVSNGLLVPRIKEEQFDVLRDKKCRMVISNYPPTQEKIDEICELLDAHGIKYNIGPPIKRFFKSLLKEPNNNPERSFKHCLFSNCHALYEGKLSMCGIEVYSYRFNEAFGEKLPESGYIDIYNTKMNGWEIDKKLRQPNNSCRYCHTAYIPYKWALASKSEASPDDYYVSTSLYERKLMPFAQKMMMPFISKTYKKYVARHNKVNRK